MERGQDLEKDNRKITEKEEENNRTRLQISFWRTRWINWEETRKVQTVRFSLSREM